MNPTTPRGRRFGDRQLFAIANDTPRISDFIAGRRVTRMASRCNTATDTAITGSSTMPTVTGSSVGRGIISGHTPDLKQTHNARLAMSRYVIFTYLSGPPGRGSCDRV